MPSRNSLYINSLFRICNLEFPKTVLKFLMHVCDISVQTESKLKIVSIDFSTRYGRFVSGFKINDFSICTSCYLKSNFQCFLIFVDAVNRTLFSSSSMTFDHLTINCIVDKLVQTISKSLYSIAHGLHFSRVPLILGAISVKLRMRERGIKFREIYIDFFGLFRFCCLFRVRDETEAAISLTA